MAHNPDVLRMARLPFRSIAEGRSVMNRCFGDLAVVILDHRLDGTPPTLSPIAQGDAETPTSTRSRTNFGSGLRRGLKPR
jgi:hypothetical protein